MKPKDQLKWTKIHNEVGKWSTSNTAYMAVIVIWMKTLMHGLCSRMYHRLQVNKNVPLSFCEMVGLTWRLHDLTEGANKWIITVEENMPGVILTLGGIKALLVHVVGKHTIEDKRCRITNADKGQDCSSTQHFNRYWNRISKWKWREETGSAGNANTTESLLVTTN